MKKRLKKKLKNRVARIQLATQQGLAELSAYNRFDEILCTYTAFAQSTYTYNILDAHDSFAPTIEQIIDIFDNAKTLSNTKERKSQIIEDLLYQTISVK